MRVGVPCEVLPEEYRVALVPSAVGDLVADGHEVIVETGAGSGAGFADVEYHDEGAQIGKEAADVFARSDLVVKVKEPQPVECRMLREGQTLFTFLHLAADRRQAELLQESGCTAIAYETVTDRHGRLPLLAPMSEIAGRISVQVGARCLEKTRDHDGPGILLGGVPGVPPAKVVVVGGGVVGSNAIQIAVGFNADVTVLDRSLEALRVLDGRYGNRIRTAIAAPDQILSSVIEADFVIGAVLIPGATAPKLLSRDALKTMRPGTVMVDVAIDQGGCFETSRSTTHKDPTYIVDDIIHYGVTNMPGIVPRTSAIALCNATLPFVREIAGRGTLAALLENPYLLGGLNVHAGKITCAPVAQALDLDFVPPEEAMLGR